MHQKTQELCKKPMEMMSQICRKVFNQKSKINIRDYILESFSSILFSEVSMKENYCREQSIVKTHRKWVY